MPQFTPSSVHSATVTFVNPKSAGFDYSASLCMGAAWTEMARASFHLNAGQSKPITFSVTMPSAPGTYPVYFKVTCGGVLISTFVATEDVVIAAPVKVVTVHLKSPPSGANWQLTLYNWNETNQISIFGLGLGEAAVFNIPPEWVWPLRIDILVYDPITDAIYCRLHSTSDSFPQFYTDIFILEPGEYPFNMVTNRLEGVAIAFPGFTLGVTGMPGDVAWWRAQVSSLYPVYPDITGSGYFGIVGRWLCSDNPTGRAVLLWGQDAGYETVTNVFRIDPLYNGKNYTFDYRTKKLMEV